MVPPACERRSRRTGISHGESSRRATRSANHGRPGQYGATNKRRTSSRRTLSRTPGSRAIGGKAYRRSSATSAPWHPAPVELDESERTRGDIVRSLETQTVTWARPNFFQICSITSVWSIHSPGLSPCLDRMSAPD